MKLLKTHTITGQISVLTGLHIGAGKDAIEIGGIDSPVVKHPHTGEPYIPGSSLKGKLRCLLEWATNRVERDGKTWEGGGEKDPARLAEDPILRIFGTTNKQWKAGPTRLVVRDAFLDKEWRDEIVRRGLAFTEEKFENNIDRIQGKAGVGIRKTERVPAGSCFLMQMVYRVFDMGDDGKTDEGNLSVLFQAMKLLEMDALGGSGSRGYGRIQFDKLTLDDEEYQSRFQEMEPAAIFQTVKVA